ncbi:MAG TPA: hypothetical protein VK624_16255 [Steroidobacteraceae bacterium]|nr:hypothetical protein [Steroidobacteraceae bacterium]
MYNPAVIMLANLRALFGVVVDIVFLRRGPENIPSSSTLLGVVVTVYVALYTLAYQAFILSAVPAAPRTWALQIVLAALIELLWFWIAFRIARKPERFVQTMTAVFATSMLFIPALAMVGALLPYMKEGSTAQPPAMLSFLTAFAGIWMVVILVRIVRSAFEWNWPRSIGFVLAANFVPVIILSLIFGDSPKPV